MHQIKMIDFKDLQIAPFKATYILRPDLLALSASLRDFGFIVPIVIQKSTNVVIDGNERLLLAQKQKHLIPIIGDKCPVIESECDSMEAQMLHLRLNRSRGNLLAKPTSNIIRNLIHSTKYEISDLSSLLQMKDDEVQLLLDGSLIKSRKISEHSYDRAWVPVEADSKITETLTSIEKPPNADR